MDTCLLLANDFVVSAEIDVLEEACWLSFAHMQDFTCLLPSSNLFSRKWASDSLFIHDLQDTLGCPFLNGTEPGAEVLQHCITDFTVWSSSLQLPQVLQL